MEFKKLSIKQFIGDLPNIINSNFDKVAKFVNSITAQSNDSVSIFASSANIEGNIKCNDVELHNNITISSLVARIEALENALSQLDPSSGIIAGYSKNSKRK